MVKSDKQPVAEVHLRTLEFEKLFTAANTLTAPLKLGRKMRVIIDYDPQKPSTVFKYFSIEDGQEKRECR